MFSSGRVSLTWLSPYTSVGAYDNMEVVEALHGHGGNTRVVWIDASDECTREHCGITGPHLKSQHEGRTA